jgi:deoxyribodipyrimidine photolyase
MPADIIHSPWEKKVNVRNYPQPMIDRHAARERTLSAYKLSKDNFDRSSK